MRAAKAIFLVLLMSSHCSFAQTKKLTLFSSNTLGVLVHLNTNLSAHSINGISINKKLHFGIGTGIEKLDGFNFLPLYIETKYTLWGGDKATNPFLSGMVGKNFSILPNYANIGGITGGIKLGVNHFFSNHFGLSFSVGYRYVYLSNSISFGSGEISLPAIYEKDILEFRLGLSIR
jgi:hypothetical protein